MVFSQNFDKSERERERERERFKMQPKQQTIYYKAKKQERSWHPKKEPTDGDKEIRCFGCGQSGHIKRLCPNFNDLSDKKNPSIDDKTPKNLPTKAGITCFDCKKKGHYASESPQDAYVE